MRSKTSNRLLAGQLGLVATMLATLVPVSCSGTSGDDDSYLVGRRPEFFSNAYLWQGGDGNLLATVDRKGRTLQQFTLEPFAHVRTMPLPLADEKQGVVASYDGSYFVTVAGDDFAILKADGTSEKNPVTLIGGIESVAFDPVHNYLVLSDTAKTMALMVLGDDGTLTASWKGGSRLAEDMDEVVRAGAMMPSGKLVLSVGPTTLAVVDIEASVAAAAWQFTSLEVADATDMKWITAVPDQTDVAMVVDGDRVLSLDIATGTILDQEEIGSSLADYFRDYIPHVITPASTGSDIHNVIYVAANGLLESKEIVGTDHQISTTLLAADGTLTIIYNPANKWTSSSWYNEHDDYYRRHEIYRFRLTDNAGLDKAVIDDEVSLAVTPSYLFLLYPSRLGKATRHSYGDDPDARTLEGYNYESILQRRGH